MGIASDTNWKKLQNFHDSNFKKHQINAFGKTIFKISGFLIEAIHSVHLALSWNSIWISAVCQQILVSSEHDTGEKFLETFFLGERKNEDGTHR